MARAATGVDVGSRTAIALRGKASGNRFSVSDFHVVAHDGANEEAWRSLASGFRLTEARVGVSGRDVNVRYVRVPRVPDWQLRKLMRFEVAEIGSSPEASVAADFNLLPPLPEVDGEDVVLLAMARESYLAAQLAALQAGRGKLDAFTPNAIGLYNAWLRFGVLLDDTVLVANIGHESIDVALVRGTDLLFARNLVGGSALFDRAVAQAFGVSEQRAERMKVEAGSLAANQTGAAGKLGECLLGPAGQVLGLLQSVVQFCRSQLRLSGLKLDRVALCGGGAALAGLDEYVSRGLGVPAEIFDPFALVDTEGLDEAGRASLEDYSLESVCALGLAVAGSDPNAYSIEILPRAVQARRELWGGKAFLVAAAVLAAAFVGLRAWQAASELEVVQARVATQRRVLESARATHARTEEARVANEDLSVLADELYTLAGSGEQVVRVLDAVHAHLPDSFWITAMSSDVGASKELGIGRERELPVLHVEGRAREGTESVGRLFQDFVAELEAALPEARLAASLGSTFQSFTLDVCTLLPPLEEEPTP